MVYGVFFCYIYSYTEHSICMINYLSSIISLIWTYGMGVAGLYVQFKKEIAFAAIVYT